jgi:T5SS/PEP-CTERM-associated repeat protein
VPGAARLDGTLLILGALREYPSLIRGNRRSTLATTGVERVVEADDTGLRAGRSSTTRRGAMNRPAGKVQSTVTGRGSAFAAMCRAPRCLPAISLALALSPAGRWPAGAVLALAFAWAGPAVAIVSQSGDVSPPFAPASAVNLAGQQVFVGNTSGGVGGTGTVNVTAGGVLTAAHLVAGTGGLGTGFVTVTGAGSTVNLTGGAAFNGLESGSWGTGVVTVSNGGSIVCASVAACAFNTVGNAAGSTGTLAISGGSVTGLGQLRIGTGALSPGFGTLGANTTATLSITNGGTLSSSGTNSVAVNFTQTGLVSGNVTIDGAGSKWSISRDLAGGGAQAGLFLAQNDRTVANMTLSNGGNLTITGSRSDPATDNSLPGLSLSNTATLFGATSTMTVTTGASIVIAGDTGYINVGGNNGGSSGGTATLNITAGGTVSGSGPNGLAFVGIGRNNATGTVNISGPGSQLLVAGVGGQNTQGLDGIGGLVLVGTNGNGVSGTLNVTNGGLLRISDNGLAASTGQMGLRIADRNGPVTGDVTVSGVGSSIVVQSTSTSPMTPYVIVGNGGASAQMTISDGATVSVLGNGQRNVIVGNTATGSSVLTMTNGATLVTSRLGIADNGGTGSVTVDNSTINLDGVVFNNGLDQGPFGASIRIARGVGADGLLTMRNGATININNTLDGSSINLGGTSVLPGGTGTLNMSGGSKINFVGPAASAALAIGAVNGTGFMSMTGGSTVNVGAKGNVNVGGNAGTDGTLTVDGGSSITANVIHVGGNSDTEVGGNGSAVVTGAGSTLNASGANGFVGVGRGGTGSLQVGDQAAVNAIIVSVGRGGFGTLDVSNASLNLSGQQTAGSLAGAGMGIGTLGGTGAVSIGNGSVVTISNPGSAGAGLNVGGSPLAPGGVGVLNVNDAQINLTAAPGKSTVRIGHDGNGIAFLNASTLNVGNPSGAAADGSLLIAAQPGSSGTLTLSAGSVARAGYVGVGATTAGPGGAGTLVLNDSSIFTTTLEIGAGGLLTGNDGVINASGDVIIAGVVSPGNSPGRVTINCNLIMLPGSLLIFEIAANGDGYSFDQLRIGSNSTFDLNAMHVVFSFLGNTDPNAFAATGGLDLDNFLQSQNEQTGAVTGLSSAFAPGQTWADVLTEGNVTTFSPVFGVGKVEISADGAMTITPVPEPSTWAMLVVGLFAMAHMARRQRARARSR